MKVFQQLNLNDAATKLLDKNLPGEFHLSGRDDRRFETFADCEIVFGNVPLDWALKSPSLRWLQLESVGVDPYVDHLGAFSEKNVTITNLHGFFGQQVAETALAGILALKRGVDKTVRLQAKGVWQGASLRYELTMLHRSRVLILGSGSIAQALKKMLAGFDAEVLLFARNPERADLTTREQLDKELSNTDIVVACLPENAGTRELFDRNRLGLLPPEALFVNVGRGSLVDETALVELLQTKRLGGAVLDVTKNEPLPAEHPFWQLPNVLLTQHCGGGTRDELPRKVEFFLDNLQRFRNGESLFGVVGR